MTRHLLNVIKDVLVERYNVRTILTTHSPSTVALAPADSIFVMSARDAATGRRVDIAGGNNRAVNSRPCDRVSQYPGTAR